MPHIITPRPINTHPACSWPIQGSVFSLLRIGKSTLESTSAPPMNAPVSGENCPTLRANKPPMFNTTITTIATPNQATPFTSVRDSEYMSTSHSYYITLWSVHLRTLRCLLALFHYESGGNYIIVERLYKMMATSYKTIFSKSGTLIPVF